MAKSNDLKEEIVKTQLAKQLAAVILFTLGFA